MQKRRVVSIAVATAAAFAIFSSSAAAAITQTDITSPTGTIRPDPDVFAAPAETIAVSGTTVGAVAGDTVDIRCEYANGTSVQSGPNGVSVDAATQTFSAQYNLNSLFLPCRLVALPSGTAVPPPVDTAHFHPGAEVIRQGHGIETIDTGPNAGTVVSFAQISSTENRLWGGGSASSTGVVGAAVDEPSLTTIPLFNFVALTFTGATKVDGLPAHAPRDFPDETLPGLPSITDAAVSLDLPTNHMQTSGSEPLATCVPDEATCDSASDTGVRIERDVDGGGDVSGGADFASTLTARDRIVNTSSQTRQVDLVYAAFGPSPAGWKFPGQTNYVAHSEGDSVTPPASGPGTMFIGGSVGAPNAVCATVLTSCATITWSTPPTQIGFSTISGMLNAGLRYLLTLGPGCSSEIDFGFSLGHPQSAVNASSSDAESALASVPSGVSCPAPPSTGGPPSTTPPPAPPAKKKKCKKHKKKKHASSAKKKKGCKKKKKRK